MWLAPFRAMFGVQMPGGRQLASYVLSVPEAELVLPQWAGGLQWSPGPARAVVRVLRGHHSQPVLALLSETRLSPGPSGSSSRGPTQALGQSCAGRAASRRRRSQASLLLASPDNTRRG